MKVASLNCNGFKACVNKGFWDWFHAADVDVLCMQEVRYAQDEFTGKWQPPSGWHWVQVDAEKKGYSGVAIWSKKKPIRTMTKIGLDWADNEGRAVGAEFTNCVIWSIYFPSGTSGAERQALKETFLEYMTPKMAQWKKDGKEVIVCGDYNIAHTALDIFHDKANANKSGFLPLERAWITALLNTGWVDAFRQVNPKEEIFSWWSNRSKTAREKDVGWRIDYQMVTPDLGCKVQGARVDKEPQISDHAPVVVTYDWYL